MRAKRLDARQEIENLCPQSRLSDILKTHEDKAAGMPDEHQQRRTQAQKVQERPMRAASRRGRATIWRTGLVHRPSLRAVTAAIVVSSMSCSRR